MKSKNCGKCAYWLTIIGSLNWGLVGIGYFIKTDLNIVNKLVGSWPTIEYIIYLIVGVAAISAIFKHKKCNC